MIGTDDFTDIEDIPENPAYKFTARDTPDQYFDTLDDMETDLRDMDSAQPFQTGEARIEDQRTFQSWDVRAYLDR